MLSHEGRRSGGAHPYGMCKSGRALPCGMCRSSRVLPCETCRSGRAPPCGVYFFDHYDEGGDTMPPNRGHKDSKSWHQDCNFCRPVARHDRWGCLPETAICLDSKFNPVTSSSRFRTLIDPELSSARDSSRSGALLGPWTQLDLELYLASGLSSALELARPLKLARSLKLAQPETLLDS